MPRSTRKGTVSLMKEHEAEGPMNQELKALEAHMLSMSKQGRLVSHIVCDMCSRKLVFGISDQVRHKLGCTATDDG